MHLFPVDEKDYVLVWLKEETPPEGYGWYIMGEKPTEAHWYRRENIDPAPDDYSLTNDIIQAFLRGDWI